MVSADSQHAMEAAKQAVAEFMKRNGHHDTTVHERVMPAVTHHTIVRTEHEEVEVARDVEQHTSHYHTTIQPITDSETLEVQHRAHVLPVDLKVFEHEDREEIRRRVAAEAAKFREEVVHQDGEHTTTHLATVEGEHHHHHIHEVIQPILNKHTVEPWIVHTAHQIHEIHHLAAKHHTASLLPTVTLAEFKKQGGILTGREERYDFFQGEPKSVSGVLGDSEKNPFPKELRTIGHEDRMHHEQAHDQDHSQAAGAVPSITHTSTGQGTLTRAPTGEGNLTRTPTGPTPGSLTHQPTGPIPAPSQPQQQSQPQTSAPHPHTDPIQHPVQHTGQFQPGTPSTGHFGLMPLQLARSAGEAVRAPAMMRSASRTPQPTTGISAPQSSVAQQVGAQTQRQGSTAGQAPQQGQQQQGQAPQQGQQGQQPGQQQPKQSQQPGSGR